MAIKLMISDDDGRCARPHPTPSLIDKAQSGQHIQTLTLGDGRLFDGWHDVMRQVPADAVAGRRRGVDGSAAGRHLIHRRRAVEVDIVTERATSRRSRPAELGCPKHSLH